MRYPPLVTSPRLALRPLRVQDAPDLHASLVSDPRVSRYLTWRPASSVEETTERLRTIIAESAGGGSMTWVIARRPAAAPPIGMLTAWSTQHGQELGYCLTPDAWGEGLMTEAVEAVTAQLLGTAGVVRVWATCDVDNRASARVLEKAGFQREGLLRKCAIHPNVGSSHRDCLLYARVLEGDPAGDP